MPGPIKQKKDRPVSSAEYDDKTGPDAVPRADKEQFIKDANAPRAPKEARIIGETDPSKFRDTTQPVAPTLVIQRPPQLPQKDAMGMMASRPVHVPTPSTVVMTSNPNITNPAGLAQYKSMDAEKEMQAQVAAQQAEAQKRSQLADAKLIPQMALGPVFGSISSDTLAKAIEAIRRQKQGQK